MHAGTRAHFLVIAATFLIALSFIVSKKLSGLIDPISLTLLRFVFASLCLAPFILANRQYRLNALKSFKRAMVISLFYALYFIGLFKALEYTTALNTGTLFTLAPLLTALLAVFVFRQKITPFQLLIYLIGIVGTCIVVFRGSWALFAGFSLNEGDMIFSFSLVAMALYSVSAKYFYRDDDAVIVLSFMTLVGGGIWMTAALTLFKIPLGWEKIEGEYFWYMAYLSIGATLLTVYLYQKATVELGAKKVMAYVYVNPAFIAVVGFLFEAKSINLYTALGIFISALATLVLLRKDEVPLALKQKAS